MRRQRIQKISSNLLWLVGNRIFRMGVGVVILGYVGRYLGPAQFGVLGYALSLAAIFSSVANLGMDGIVIRELVKNPDKLGKILGAAFWLRLVGGGLALSLVAVSTILTGVDDITVKLALITAIAFFPQSLDVIDLWFQKNIESRFTVVARAGALLLSSGLRVGLVLGGASLAAFAWAIVAEGVFNAVGMAWVYRWRGQRIGAWKFHLGQAGGLLRDSWPLILSGVLVALYMRVEQLLVMDFLGRYSMGIYSASARLAETWGFVPGVVLATIYPLLVEKRQQDRAAYTERMQLVFDLLTGLGMVVMIGAVAASQFIIPLIYGDQFKDAALILVIQACCAPLTFNGSVRAQYLLLENLNVYHTFSAALGIAANVATAVLLMPKWGAAGAALGALVGFWVSAHLSSFLFAELRECAWMQTRALLLPFRVSKLVRFLRSGILTGMLKQAK